MALAKSYDFGAALVGQLSGYIPCMLCLYAYACGLVGIMLSVDQYTVRIFTFSMTDQPPILLCIQRIDSFVRSLEERSLFT